MGKGLEASREGREKRRNCGAGDSLRIYLKYKSFNERCFNVKREIVLVPWLVTCSGRVLNDAMPRLKAAVGVVCVHVRY